MRLRAPREKTSTRALGVALPGVQIAGDHDKGQTVVRGIRRRRPGNLIQAQADFVRISRPPEAFAGAIGSAGPVIINSLRSLGGEGDVAARRGTDRSRGGGSAAQPLLDAVGVVLQSAAAGRPGAAGAGQGEGRRDVGAGAIRVDVDKIDAIVDLTGELLVVKNAFAHSTRLAAEGGDAATLAASLRTQTSRLDRHVSDLQRAVLDLRVLPLGRVFSRFPLLVRETSSRLASRWRSARRATTQSPTRLSWRRCSSHCFMSCATPIDHGIEPPDVRVTAGKACNCGYSHARAWREGEHVLVEVSDDGRGVDTLGGSQACRLTRGGPLMR